MSTLMDEGSLVDDRGAVLGLAALAVELEAAGDVGAIAKLTAARGVGLVGAGRSATHLRDASGSDLDRGLARELDRADAPALVRDGRALVVPLVAAGEVLGVILWESVERSFDEDDRELAVLLGRMAGAAATALRRRAQLEGAMRQNRLLRGAASVDARLSEILLDGGGVGDLTTAVAGLTGLPTAYYDAELRRVAVATLPDRGDAPQVRLLEQATRPEVVAEMLHAAAAGTTVAIAPMLGAGVRYRHLVAPVDVRGERCGWVVAMEHARRMGPFDELVLRRAARHVALEFLAQRRESSTAWDARSLLARQLIRGTQDEDVRRGARHLGVDLSVPRVVAFITRASQSGAVIDAAPLVEALGRRTDGEVLATQGPRGLAALIDLPDRDPALPAVREVKRALAAAFAEIGLAAIAGVSSACRDPGAVPRGYREACEVARCIDQTDARQRVLTADDLGPGRLLVARADAIAVRAFVEDVLGGLLAGDAAGGLLRTLQIFYDNGRSVRRTAAHLRVHENTVRNRLTRVRDVTGLDVAASAEDQLSVQMALLVLRLQAHPGLPPFDDGDDEQDASVPEAAA